ncbi:S9 family peptidase [Nakamurella aerolata]|uniref:S9 family peptidase n=1 Tax=Nakamurella aerolata TaxID=1656892 RepID=A0A849AC66_9ACTN|nr:prolyl oligopeptidase family serine peptidase [Nakamurella aerolata]NNG36728.1 S9 family peptidase [Nakamurella aerolata]
MADPYGSWPSPITIELLTAGSIGLDSPSVDSDPDAPVEPSVYWLESRSSEQGRSVLVRRRPDGTTEDVTPAPFNVRSSVHEYGGGAYAVADSTVVFSNFADGRVYVIDPPGSGTPGAGEPRPITPDLPGRLLRYADLQLDLPRRRVIAVREDHRGLTESRDDAAAAASDAADAAAAADTAAAENGGPGGEPGAAEGFSRPAEPVNTLVRIDLDGESLSTGGDVLVDGHDFVASPRLSPDGHRLAWQSWEHPNMPWDNSTLWLGDADAADATRVDGGTDRAPVSVADIGWLADDRLAWCSDRTGFWNLYATDPDSAFGADGASGAATALYPVDADCAGPAWVFGQHTWAQTASGAVLIGRHDPAGVTLVRLDVIGAEPAAELDVALASVDGLAADGDDLVCLAGFTDRLPAIIRVERAGDPAQRPAGPRVQVLRAASEVQIDPAAVSVAEPVSWTTPDGATAFGFFYPPVNPDVDTDPAELPPLVVLSHGGPTAATSPALKLPLQYWTSRGIAVLDVNYGGSTGYGRAYRDRLQGTWGVVDVDDCCSGATALAEQGRVDGKRLAIKGGSAGGYTTLAALTFRDVFTAGVSRYGIGDLEMLATDTHKFESRYLDGLVGPYPQQRQRYRDRSPIHHVDQLSSALLVLQGADDKVVPPNQAEQMAAAVRAKGLPVALRIYQGEGHGFRGAEAVTDSIQSELSFYGRVFGFTPADPLPDLEIENL